MKRPGRRSKADLTAANLVVPIGERLRRPPPPVDMPDDMADVWRDTVDSMPGDWFPRETHELLKQYCRHVVSVRRVRQFIEQLEAGKTFDLEDYDRLLRMQEREGRAMSSLATRMRITQQSRINATTGGRMYRDDRGNAPQWNLGND